MRRLVTKGCFVGLMALATLTLAGCGSQYVLLHPAGPVAASELHLMITVAAAMAAVLAFVFVLFGVVIVRFRDRPGNRAPYLPQKGSNRRLELLLFAVPLVIVAIIAVPTVQRTFALGQMPRKKHPLVIDVTSLDWKWLFEYPGQHIATVNQVRIPVGVPVLFKLTANSPINAFWVPRLGGMEATMPGRVLPLWLQADHAGIYLGRSANFSGKEFAKMTFKVHAVPPSQFQSWAQRTKAGAPALSMAVYKRLLHPGLHPAAAYSSYPQDTFPKTGRGFTLVGGLYQSAP